MTNSRPEVLAPAGDPRALEAAIRAGADAVYFGVDGFNARARAQNFDLRTLADTVRLLHASQVKAHLTLNTLVFDAELEAWADVVRAAAEAGVDAIIVQDLGAVGFARRIAPDLRIHASTQMTCTDAASVEFAASLGADRVVLARELSLDDIARIALATSVELEVFVHGALCVAYSGQCLTSEAIGGRSANRGSCAQACRLPYELVVDGVLADLGERAYLLSPQDLEGSAAIPRLIEIGVRSFKIEGRLKNADYVAATTRLYRQSVDAVLGSRVPSEPVAAIKRRALQSYSRGSGPGFLLGLDHQRLVEARSCDHRGLLVGQALGVEDRAGRRCLLLETSEVVARGDGLLVEGGWASEGEFGGRVWAIEVDGEDVAAAPAGGRARLWFGPERELGKLAHGRRVFRTHDPETERQIAALRREPYRDRLNLRLSGKLGQPFILEGWSARGGAARVTGDSALSPAQGRATTHAEFVEKLGRLGESRFVLGELEVDLPSNAWLPVSALNRARRALLAALAEASPSRLVRAPERKPMGALRALAAPPPAGLFALCRNRAQAEAAIAAGVDGVYLDFLELTGTGEALRALRAAGARVGVAPPRIRKPGEEKIDRYLESLAPDAILVRSLGALFELASREASTALAVGDFSLNVSNRLSALEVLSRGLSAFTPSFDLDSPRLLALLSESIAPYAEVVLHHPMPLFHMEHCVIAALLSDGADHLSCGRPCERHQLSLRDRAQMDHPLEADVGCRNTVFHASSQSAAELVPALLRAGVRRFRLELVRESAEEATRVVHAYQDLLASRLSGREVFRSLRASGGYGVVRGSLRVLGD